MIVPNGIAITKKPTVTLTVVFASGTIRVPITSDATPIIKKPIIENKEIAKLLCPPLAKASQEVKTIFNTNICFEFDLIDLTKFIFFYQVFN
jgi:hypothetical protein